MNTETLAWVQSPFGDVCTQGAHVARWLSGGRDVLFLSRRSRFERGQAIRGGVPVIFPWFGDDPEGLGRPAHGFARRMTWNLVEKRLEAEALHVALELSDDAGTRALWPHAFGLRLEAELGAALTLTLRVENRDGAPLRFETALHTYLAIGDVRRATLSGLAGATFLDKLDGGRRHREGRAPLAFTGEIDRVYVDTGATCTLEDPVLGRTLTVEKEGSRSTVVWNPWVEKAARLADMADDEWPAMLCVESGNVADDRVTLAPGATHTQRVRIRCS